MTLAAAQVVDAIAARLTGLALTGTRVYTSRAWPLAEGDLPAWRVTAEDESVSLETIDGQNQHRLSIECAASAKAVANLDDSLHALAEQGLAGLWATPPPYGLQLEGIGREMAKEGEAAVGVITLRLSTFFFVNPSAPGTFA